MCRRVFCGATLLLVAVTLLAACGPWHMAQPLDTAAPTAMPSATLPLLTVDPALQGTEWVLASLRGAGLDQGSRITLSFAGKGYGGTTGCNNYGGDLKAANERTLTFSDIEMTLQACPGAVGLQESAYLKVLTSAVAYRLTGDRLELQDASGETVLVYVPQPEFTVEPPTQEPLNLDDTPGTTGTLAVLTIRAYVDGRSQLIIQGDTIRWHHLDFAAPGRLEGANEPTYINQAAWYPSWPDNPDAENRDCGCDSSTSAGLPLLGTHGKTASLEIVQAREKVTLVQQPEAGNNYTLIAEFDDDVSGGADWYEVDISYLESTAAAVQSASHGIDTTTWQQQSPALCPSPRAEMGFVYDTARDVVVAVGGTDWASVFDETWEYTSGRWTLRDDLPQSPPGRLHPAIAYNPDEQVTVLFGGNNQATFYDDTWHYDGHGWIQVHAPNPPSPRNGAAMAYDPARRLMLLVGGYCQEGNAFFDETWEYDGDQWIQRFPAHHPEAREGASLVYDSRRGVMVLFGGGRMAGSVVFDDTWEWDGEDWIQRLDLSTSPPARWAHAMTYDERRQRTMLSGGLTGVTGQYDDTWEYDGQTWSQVSTPTRPPARWGAGMAYDSISNRTVLFGGMHWDQDFAFLNDTWTYEPAPAGACPLDSSWSADLNTTLQPGVLHGWVLRPSSADGGYIVEVTPLRPSVDGAHVEVATVRPEFGGAQWNDVLRVQIPAGMPPLEVNVRVYQSCGLPVVADFEAMLTSGDVPGWAMGPVSTDRGLLAEVTPLGPSLTGARVDKVLVQPEYVAGEWQDLLHAQIPAGQPDLRAHFRVYAMAGMPVFAEHEFVLEPGVWTGVALRPSTARGGYLVEINPLDAPSGGEYVERAVVQPEFNGKDWNDVLRLQAPAGQPSIRVQVRVYVWDK